MRRASLLESSGADVPCPHLGAGDCCCRRWCDNWIGNRALVVSPTSVQAMQQLKETVVASQGRGLDGTAYDGTALMREAREYLTAPIFALLVVELYEALGEQMEAFSETCRCTYVTGCGSPYDTDIPCAQHKALRAAEAALVAWAEGVADAH